MLLLNRSTIIIYLITLNELQFLNSSTCHAGGQDCTVSGKDRRDQAVAAELG